MGLVRAAQVEAPWRLIESAWRDDCLSHMGRVPADLEPERAIVERELMQANDVFISLALAERDPLESEFFADELLEPGNQLCG